MQNVELLKTRYNRGKGGTKKMCVVLSNINIKGGIGKTIGNATMAEILAKCGKRVLLVDNDSLVLFCFAAVIHIALQC